MRETAFMTEPSAAEAPLILLVDDVEDNLDVYTAFLQIAGYRVEPARDGEEALERAAAVRPHLILMDMALPRLDGWEATMRLKADPTLAHIPVVALTAHAFPAGLARCTEVGCVSYLIKPCLPQAVAEEVRRVLALPAR